jgi:tetratricopeptide (TPR) repeat protein
MNLEMAPPGGDPSRRGSALRGAGELLGADAAAKATALAAWSDLARGAVAEAYAEFKAIVEQRPDDIAAWEGLRDASARLGNHLDAGLASARLGSLCSDDLRAAEFWEQAGLTLLEHTDAKDDAEIAFERSLERDPTRFVAFDKLFRRVRARNEDDRQLQLITHRLQVTEDETEITKMYWERARVLRRKGDQDGALQALKDVTMLEPDHVGALALAGEINITRGDFVAAAPLLARLSLQDEAPKQQRLVSGVAAADLYEKKLNEPAKSLEVLSGLHHAGLSTPPVRERLARTAARVGQWEEATSILEQLMEERETGEGRAEAARLAMAIYRDKLREPNRASKAVGRLVTEIPDDAEAIHLLLSGHLPDALRASAVTVAHRTLLKKLLANPFDVDRVQLLADIARAQTDAAGRRAALGCLVALGKDRQANKAALATLAATTAQVPQMVLGDSAILEIADDHDTGPWAELFAALAQTIADALGPSLRSEGVGRKQRIDDSAHPIRSDVARWMATLGFGADFQLYQGGRDGLAIKGVADSEPTLVIGAEVRGPLDEVARAAVAREVFALRRGTTAVLHYDDHTIASIGIAASIEAGVKMKEPPFAVYPEVSRAVKKAMSRKVRKLIGPICQRVQQSGVDPNAWAAAAQRSIDRMALIACGDASVVIDDIVGPPDAPARKAIAKSDRAKRLLSFALSPDYLSLRQKLGMGTK